MYGWVPLAIMGEEINKLEKPVHSQARLSIDLDDGHEFELASLRGNSSNTIPATSIQSNEEAVFVGAGVYLGIWNIFATVPQFLATFIAMVAFSILEPGKSPELTEGDGEEGSGASWKQNSRLSGTAVCLAIGAICSFVGAAQTFRLRRN